MTQVSARQLFGMEFSMLARRWRTFLDTALQTAGLTEAAWAPLVHLHRLGDGVQQKVLAARIGIDTSTLVRLIDILEKSELVTRQIDPADRRGRLIHMTDKGRACVTHIEATISEAENSLLANLDDATLEDMRRHIALIGENIDRLSQAQ